MWLGACAFTQVLDIAHGLSSVVEKGLDYESKGAVAQSDIRQFYDSVNLLRIFRYLVSKGLPKSLAAACMRHQLLPQINVKFGAYSTCVGNRSVGCLTGSRLAGMAARVPVEHVCVERANIWSEWGFTTPHGVLTVSTYVDNLFAAGKSCYYACKI